MVVRVVTAGSNHEKQIERPKDLRALSAPVRALRIYGNEASDELHGLLAWQESLTGLQTLDLS